MIETRKLLLLLIVIVWLFSGCGSDSSYIEVMEATTTLIQESAFACASVARSNEMRTRAEALYRNQSKPTMNPQMVDPSSQVSLEQDWLTVETQMAGLVNPPEQFKEASARVQEMHDAYVKLYQLAVNPSGPLDQYSYTLAILQQVINSKQQESRAAYAVK